jgi:hypothetical protein
VTEKTPFAEWVVLELMGHRRLAGYLTEQEIAGRGFLRLDVPGVVGVTQFYNPTSVYCITPTTEAVATVVADSSQPAPVQRWELEPAAVLSDTDGGPF